jgi:hypothetical protein
VTGLGVLPERPSVTALVRPRAVDDEFMALARTTKRSEEDEQRFTEMNAAHMSRLLAAQPDDVFDVVGPAFGVAAGRGLRSAGGRREEAR